MPNAKIPDSKLSELPSAGLFRRLAVLVYDALMLLAVLFLATALALPLTQGEAVDPQHPLFQLYLLAAAFLYFGWFWTHGGQTVAMRAWRLRLRDAAGGPVGWGLALTRFAAVLLPVAPALLWLRSGPEVGYGVMSAVVLGCWLCGFLWIAVDREDRAWHDIVSKTRITLEP